jgi:hypothetical protein
MESDNEPRIKVPIRLFKNLIDCIDAQKTLSSSNINDRDQMQTVIDNTKEWAKEILRSETGINRPSTDLQETLDFVKTGENIKMIRSTCDTESESSCVMIVEPDNVEGGFL